MDICYFWLLFTTNYEVSADTVKLALRERLKNSVKLAATQRKGYSVHT